MKWKAFYNTNLTLIIAKEHGDSPASSHQRALGLTNLASSLLCTKRAGKPHVRVKVLSDASWQDGGAAEIPHDPVTPKVSMFNPLRKGISGNPILQKLGFLPLRDLWRFKRQMKRISVGIHYLKLQNIYKSICFRLKVAHTGSSILHFAASIRHCSMDVLSLSLAP